MFTKTFPTLAQSGYLAKGCKIWLPALQCIEESLGDFQAELAPYYIVRKESNAKCNPLYLATEDVEEELLMCPDALTNETQMRPLYNFSAEPFYVLELRSTFLNLSTPTRSIKTVSATLADSSVKKRKICDDFNSGNESSSGSDTEEAGATRNLRKLKPAAATAKAILKGAGIAKTLKL